MDGWNSLSRRPRHFTDHSNLLLARPSSGTYRCRSLIVSSNYAVIRTATVGLFYREQKSLYVHTITANDQGQPPLTNTVTVYLDRNDNTPIFEYQTISNDTVHV